MLIYQFSKIEISNLSKHFLQKLKSSFIWNNPGNAIHSILALLADNALSTESSIAMHSFSFTLNFLRASKYISG